MIHLHYVAEAASSRAPSTKPLFRAKRRRNNPAQPDLMNIEDSHRPPEERRQGDFYATVEPEAIRALLSRDRKRLSSISTIWEPAAGAGHLTRHFEEFGFNAVASDLEDRGCPGVIVQNFYQFREMPGGAKAIITNPPYSEINARDGSGRWLRHTLSLPGWTYAAYLLNWDWPAARQNGLGELMDTHPFSYCYLCRWKLDFTGAGSPPQRNAWFVWDKEFTGTEPAFRFLDWDEDSRQRDLGL